LHPGIERRCTLEVSALDEHGLEADGSEASLAEAVTVLGAVASRFSRFPAAVLFAGCGIIEIVHGYL
jgi:hypothetical protein